MFLNNTGHNHLVFGPHLSDLLRCIGMNNFFLFLKIKTNDEKIEVYMRTVKMTKKDDQIQPCKMTK